ncbi:MAG: hypothetical protein IT324_10945 [Anaerolineae bacterium]|nr:hypothetical protein [Anaerolineae bacterium]
MAISPVHRPGSLPTNYPPTPVVYPLSLFRPQIEAAQRYLFGSELKEVLEAAGISVPVPGATQSLVINVAQIACFMQELKQIAGEDKAVDYGREAFQKAAALFTRTTTTNVLRAVSPTDKAFLRIRDTMSGFSRQTGANVIVKWHGGKECDLFEDTGQHCYGYASDAFVCQTMTGFLQEAIVVLSGVKIALTECDCMATGALACRWHGVLV